MHLVVDSGSTKTEWKIVSNTEFHLLTNGLNPLVASYEFLEREIKNASQVDNIANKIERIDFYGAGCSKTESAHTIETILNQYFPIAKIAVYSDIVAAAKAVFNDNAGISCILGTGSNAAYFDGKEIYQNKPALGYILGDDGAGVGIGRALLKQFLYGNLDWLPLIKAASLTTEAKDIIQEIYTSPKPNTLIANYAKVALNNLDVPFVRTLVKSQFNLFFDDMVNDYVSQSNKIGFVGSVAFFGSDLINQICEERNLKLVSIVKHPIQKIVKAARN